MKKTSTNKYQRISITNDFDEKFLLFKTIIEKDLAITAYIEKENIGSDGKKKGGTVGRISPAIRYLIDGYLKRCDKNIKKISQGGEESVETSDMGTQEKTS